jgi:hypothetical protein
MPLGCPTCDYDLTGLPDGACPECGAVFRHAELMQPRVRREPAIGAWLVVFVIMALVFSAARGVGSSDSGGAIMLAGALVGLLLGTWVMVREDRWRNCPLVLAFVFAVFFGLFMLLRFATGSNWLISKSVMLALVGMSLPVLAARPRWGLPMIALSLVPMATRGAEMFANGLVISRQGYRWTNYDWNVLDVMEGGGRGIEAVDAVWYGVVQLAAWIVIAAIAAGAARISRAPDTRGPSWLARLRQKLRDDPL